MGFHSLVNTRYFSEAALDFKKNKGRYITAPRGTRDYNDYWDLQEKRCFEGYQVGDLWIPGKHYFYLNFTPIMRIPDSALARAAMAESRDKRGNLSGAVMEKIMTFPKFFEIDYEWYNFKDIAWYGGEFMGIHSPGARHMCAVKTRGAGWSYKEASEGVYNYNFIPKSKSYYFAAMEDYLIKDGILNKVQEMMDFINDNIPRWRQNRMKRNNPMYYKASYLDKEGQEKGSLSEIYGLIVNNPNKVRGKRGIKITFEEGGSFKGLKEALAVSVGNISDGGFTIGQISVFGTGGEEGPSIEGLDEIFNDPDSYNMLSFPNIWEEGMEGTECGYFVPCYRANIKHMDEDGNVDLVSALKEDQEARDIKAKAADPKELDRRKAEYPRIPSEALQRLSSNVFNVGMVNARIKYLKAHKGLVDSMLRTGWITRDSKGVAQFTVDASLIPLRWFPHKKNDDLTGCVEMLEPPFKDRNGETPDDMYFITVDPCYKEEIDEVVSLWMIRVWKNYNPYDAKYEGLPVAWYSGRPQDFDLVYLQMFGLADLYNCKIQSEIAGGGQGIIDFAKRPDVNRLEKLEYAPEYVLESKDFRGEKNAPRFMDLPTEKKRLGLTYLANWHTQVRHGSDDGKLFTNLDYIWDIAFLEEMKKFKHKGNYDRVSEGILAMFMLKEYVHRVEEEAQINKPDGFFSRHLYSGAGEQEPYYEENSNVIVDAWGGSYGGGHVPSY